MKPRSGRIAVFSPLPPAPSGIAAYAVRLLGALDSEFECDVVVEDPSRVDPAIRRSRRVVGRLAFEREHRRGTYAGNLFHLGNSEMHAAMLEPLFRYGGAVVLHEVVLDGLAEWLTAHRPRGLASVVRSALPSSWLDAMRKQHAATGFGKTLGAAILLDAIASSASSILVHSRHAESMLRERVVGIDVPIVVSALACPPVDPSPRPAHRGLVFGAFGWIQPDKGIETIVAALEQAAIPDARLVLVGAPIPGTEGWLEELVGAATKTPITVTGQLDDDAFHDAMRGCDVAFALRSTSRGESSAALSDLLAHGVPTLVTNRGSFAEVPEGAVVHVDAADRTSIVGAIRRLAGDADLRARTGAGARAYAERTSFTSRVDDYVALLGELPSA